MGLKLIGVTGKARSGKDTVATILVEEHGFVRTAFADPLKQAAAILFDWPPELAFSDSIKEHLSPFWNMTGREIMQKFGTEAMRGTFGEDFWVKRWVTEYARLSPKHSIVVSDVRTDTEANAIRDLGGIIVHLRRDSAGLAGAEALHSSEAGIKFDKASDIWVDNNGTVADLVDEAHRLIAFVETEASRLGFRNVKIEQ
jgi:hypothetical protein